MAEEYKLWNVTYQYRASHIDGNTPMSEKYVLLAKSPEEALDKADELFSYCSLNKDLIANGEAHSNEVKLSHLRRSACEYRKRISLPKLTLDSDREKFNIRARIGNDGRTLEFIVVEK